MSQLELLAPTSAAMLLAWTPRRGASRAAGSRIMGEFPPDLSRAVSLSFACVHKLVTEPVFDLTCMAAARRVAQ
jgi:hypothetical protein